jgi:hypothetical protein
MSKKWNYFLAAAVFAGFFLVRGGAPPLPVAFGIAGAALLILRSKSSAI